MTSAEIYSQTVRHFLAPIWPLLEDNTVSEVLINGHDTIYVERKGKISTTTHRFADASSLLTAVRNIAEFVGRTLDSEHHSLDARLPDGSRVHVMMPPVSRQGICVSIRKFQRAFLTLDALVANASLSAEAAEFLQLAVRVHRNMVVAGGTGTGKTSLLNALSACIPHDERIIVIEDSSELQLQQPHTLYLEAQPGRSDGKGQVTIRDMFVDSLRMRPDRIVVGEVRRGEALDLIQSMLSGHSGAMTTVHASTPHDAAVRLETLCLMNDVGLPVHVARMQVASAVQLLVQLTRFPDGSRRIRSISELLGIENSGYRLVELYRFQAAGRAEDGRIMGALSWTGTRASFADELVGMGLGGDIYHTTGVFSRSV